MPRKRPPIAPEVLRTARLRKGMTQEDVQRECIARGAPGGNVSRMELGVTKWPHPRTIAAITEVLGLTLEELCPAAPGAGPPTCPEDTEEDQRAA